MSSLNGFKMHFYEKTSVGQTKLWSIPWSNQNDAWNITSGYIFNIYLDSDDAIHYVLYNANTGKSAGFLVRRNTTSYYRLEFWEDGVQIWGLK